MRWLKTFFSPWGRIGRRRFWFAILVAVLVVVLPLGGLIGAAFHDDTVVTSPRTTRDFDASAAESKVFAEILTFLLVTLVVVCCAAYICAAACARRYNDRGKSSWWVFIGFVPVIGPVWCIVELGFLRGTRGRNRYGARPGGETAEISAIFDGAPSVIVEHKGRASNLVAVLLAWAASTVSVLSVLVLLFQNPSR